MYALFCEDEGGVGYVKIGRSSNIGKRLSALRMACPVPAKYLALLEVEDKYQSERIEKALHLQFEARRSTGEWFRFDFSSAEDKHAFNLGCRLVFGLLLGPLDQKWWEKIDLEAYDRDAAAHVAMLMKSGKLGLATKNARQRYEQQKAWKELAR